MKHLTPAQVERVEWFSDVPGFAEYVDDVIGYLHTAREYPPERLKAYKIRQEILAGRQVPDAWFNATQILTGAPAETLIEHWNPSKVPNVNRELHNAIRFFVVYSGPFRSLILF